MKILNTIIPITPGLPVMFYSRGNAIDATIKKLNATLDKNGASLKSRPKVREQSDSSANKNAYFIQALKSGDMASVDILVRNGINFEKWEDVKELSRMILRYSGETIGIGKIVNYSNK